MSGLTPVFRIPYLVDTDDMADVAMISQQQAEGIERQLRGRVVVPNLASLADEVAARKLADTALSDRITAAIAALTPGPWTPLTYSTGWASVNGFRPMSYRKNQDTVELAGLAYGPSASGSVIGVLPVGFRPAFTEVFDFTADGANFGRFDVLPSGVISRQGTSGTPSGTYISITGKSFRLTA